MPPRSPFARSSHDAIDPAVVNEAAAARSIVSCPDQVDLVVAGGIDVQTGEPMGMTDTDGSPTFTCRPGSPLSEAAGQGRNAILRLTSGLQPADRLTLGGRLELVAHEDCPCCEEEREVVVLHLADVVLTPEGGEPRALSLAAYGATEHRLNRGYLQRCTDHANGCHQDQLRSAISTTMATTYADILGVRLDGLTAAGVNVTWVDPSGAHRERLDFSRTAGDAADLAELLRDELHTGLC